MEHLRAELHRSLGSFRDRAVDSFCARRDAIASTGIDLLGLPGVGAAGRLDRRSCGPSIRLFRGTALIARSFASKWLLLGLPVQFLDALPEPGAKIHAADFFLRQAGGNGLALPRIECERGDVENFAAIHPFSGSARKNWPLDRFRELAARLALPVRWCAGPQEALPKTFGGAVRFENLYDLACWLARARVYIGNDSGITHLAAAVGTPVVAIFGPTDPAVWAPRGEGVFLLSGRGLDEISVDDVLEKARWIP